jgi:hypothetical protein
MRKARCLIYRANDTGDASGLSASRIDTLGVNTKILDYGELGLVVNAASGAYALGRDLIDILDLDFRSEWFAAPLTCIGLIICKLIGYGSSWSQGVTGDPEVRITGRAGSKQRSRGRCLPVTESKKVEDRHSEQTRATFIWLTFPMLLKPPFQLNDNMVSSVHLNQ